MSYSKSPAKMDKIKSEAFLKPKNIDSKDNVRKLQDQLFLILKQNKDIQSRVVKSQSDNSNTIQISKEENKDFLSRLKKVVEKKTSQKVVFSSNDSFIEKHFEQIKEVLAKKGYSLNEVNNIREPSIKSDVGKAYDCFQTTFEIKTPRESFPLSETHVCVTEKTVNDFVVEVLNAHDIKNVSSHFRALSHANFMTKLEN